MSYLKYSANELFTGTELLDNNAVLITTKDGTIEAIVSIEDAGENVQTFDGIVSPGFVNAHCHTELSHLKDCIPTKTGLTNFILEIVQQRNASNEIIAQAVQNAENEMLQNGIVAVGDICNNTHSLLQKKQSKLQWYNFIEAAGWLPQVAQSRFEVMQQVAEQFAKLPYQYAIVPHAPYSVSNELWQLINHNFLYKTISIHNQETLAEDELFMKGTGSFIDMYTKMRIEHSTFKPTKESSFKTCLPKLKNAKQLLFVHNTFTQQEDVDFLIDAKLQSAAFFCLCVNANLYIENTLPNIELLRKNKLNITLGTDSLASNHSLNLLDEMNTIQQHFPQIPLAEILQWATLNGAKALQMDDTLGSFEKGKKPGVILIQNKQAKRLI
ncbi:MAG TPA: amidohydrolase family protein [Chitinophagaceae bacterium]|nr:amidohydrolase family protein [Chitinophagaceae bacterium]